MSRNFACLPFAIIISLGVIFLSSGCSSTRTPSAEESKHLFHFCIGFPFPPNAEIVEALQTNGGLTGDNVILVAVHLEASDFERAKDELLKRPKMSASRARGAAFELAGFLPHQMDLFVERTNEPAFISVGMTASTHRVYMVSTTF